MPITVPRYNESQIDPNSEPLTRAHGLSPEAFGAGMARGLGQTAGAFGNLSDLAQREREKEALTALNDAKLTMGQQKDVLLNGQADETGNVKGGLLNLKGVNAKGLEVQATGQWKKAYDEQHQKLSAYPEAQTLFRQWSTGTWQDVALSLNRHEHGERQKAAVESQGAIIDQTTEGLIKDAAGGKPLDFKSLDGSVATLGALNGSTPEEMANEQKTRRSVVIGEAVRRGLNSGDDAAIRQSIALFDTHKDALDSKVRDALEPHVTQIKVADSGESRGREIWDRLGPKGLNDPINSVAMDKALDAIPNKAERRFAEQEVSSKIARWNSTQSEQQQANVSIVTGMILDRRPIKSILASSAWAGLPKTAQLSLKNTIESEYGLNRRGGSGMSPEERAEMRIVQAESLANIMDQIESGEVRVRDGKEAFRFADRLGLGNTTKLYNFIERHNKALKKMPFTRDTFNETLREMRAEGITFVPNPDDKKNAEMRGNVALLYDAVTSAVADTQDREGKVLDRDGLKKTMRKMLAPQVVNSKWQLFGINVGDTKETKPAYLVKHSGNIDVARTLEGKLGRRPTSAEVAEGKRRLGAR